MTEKQKHIDPLTRRRDFLSRQIITRPTSPKSPCDYRIEEKLALDWLLKCVGNSFYAVPVHLRLLKRLGFSRKNRRGS